MIEEQSGCLVWYSYSRKLLVNEHSIFIFFLECFVVRSFFFLALY
jgi:hypothetical protein